MNVISYGVNGVEKGGRDYSFYVMCTISQSFQEVMNMNNKNIEDILVMDLETTGLNPREDRIVEIAIEDTRTARDVLIRALEVKE